MNPIRPLYTIGYGNRTVADFIALLKKFEIQYLIDVRSKPVSKFNSDFSRVRIEASLSSSGIRYVYFGKMLGGLPEDPRCYTDGRVDYAKVEQQPWYQAGIARLKTAWEKQIPLALMCTELKPEACHRSKLIGQTLRKMGIQVVHIDMGYLFRRRRSFCASPKVKFSYLRTHLCLARSTWKRGDLLRQVRNSWVIHPGCELVRWVQSK